MQKIPTVFKRDPENMRRVLSEVTPGCEWVLAGEGEATRKYDGTCTMLSTDGRWWARREVKPGKQEPPNFLFEQHDEATGKTVGWEPMEQSAFAKWHMQAIEHLAGLGIHLESGTYELIGPKINGNPERQEFHTLVRHRDAEALPVGSLSFEGLRDTVVALRADGVEGLVWHHPDGRMAKLKGRDFRS